MSVIINGKDYGDIKEIRVGIRPEFSFLSSRALSDRTRILNVPIDQIQHGMMIFNRGKEEIIDSIYVTPEDTRTSFYHLHIYKTSGLSLRSNISSMFAGLQCYTNFIGLYDEKQVLSSKLISGHFFRKPIEDFKLANKKLHSFTLVRNPIDRMISHYVYERHLYRDATVSLDGFNEFLYSEQRSIENLQSKNITSSMDTEASNIVAKALINGEDSLEMNFRILGKTNRHISNHTNEHRWMEYMPDFSLIGTMDNRDRFMSNLNDLLKSENYKGSFGPEQFVNKSKTIAADFKKTLTKDIIDRIYNLNEYDFQLYDHLISKEL
jgi:hypothetical protein